MLDSPSLRIAVRRDRLRVEQDLRSTTVPDDPVQRRDLILLERARGGELDAFNDLVELYQDQLFALVVRMVPDRDQAADAVQEAFFSAYRNLHTFRGGSVKAWLNRICLEWVLGIRPTWDGLLIDPCVPRDLGAVEVTRRWSHGNLHGALSV